MNEKDSRSSGGFGIRGTLNIGVLILLLGGLMCLFILYPVITFVQNNQRNLAIDGNININGTGQNPVLFGMPSMIDTDTPDSAKSRTGFDGQDYELVFSDEFNVDGRTFYPGDDPYWEAVDLWYWATNDQEWYDPGQVTTTNGSLKILIENTEWKGLPYRSGMLQSWNKFCFTGGYIEVSITLPGPDQNTQGYWPGAWTMGNLGRPGYGGTTDGTWPYSYTACDVGTFPNQTYSNKSGPAAALHSDWSKSKYNYELSWLTGQKLSSCTCSGEDHPGPNVGVGRGAPEIDILEVERNKLGDGQVVSQSAQFAPFTHDYIYLNATSDEWTVYDPTISRANTYTGSAVQQAVSGLTQVPADAFMGSGQVFTQFGFEYWEDPKNIDDTFITWQVDGKPSVRMGPGAVAPDPIDSGGSGVDQRLIPQEPMSIVFNLGISTNWQEIDLTTMEFPAYMLVDYVRVYQRKGHTNVGCSPKDFPTEDYINAHSSVYNNPNITTWPYSMPKNSLVRKAHCFHTSAC
ncbi:glycoside hydrolase family 16 protein [Plicaturopsis crispa FD-325 SS-3]|nr:glycoside hydrolase family 16 protein [Plicaturopsis crispa FD-325 SS-3]